MPAYEKFAARTSDLPAQQRAIAFVRDFAPRYPDYYAPEVFGEAARLQAHAVRYFDPAQAAVVFKDVPPLTAGRLAALAGVVGPQFARQQRRFMRSFPDFNCHTIVELGVSLLEFDGHGTQFGNGTYHLLFGVDVMAMFHGPGDMPAFFDHELFHLYHQQVVAWPQGENPAWWMMWVEGLATYVSQRMNPGLDAQQVLWYPRDIVARMEQTQTLTHAARLMLRDIDKTGPDADRWFHISPAVQGLPVRAGYYLGYLFARFEGGGHSLPQLARMAPQQLHRDAVTFLTQLAHAGGAATGPSRGSGVAGLKIPRGFMIPAD